MPGSYRNTGGNPYPLSTRAYPDLLRKAQGRYAGRGVTLRRVIADAAYAVAGLWTFTRTGGLTPVFAPHTPP